MNHTHAVMKAVVDLAHPHPLHSAKSHADTAHQPRSHAFPLGAVGYIRLCGDLNAAFDYM